MLNESIAPVGKSVWLRDLVIVVAITALAAVLFVSIDTFEALEGFLEVHEAWELDELLLVLLTALLLTIWFAWRRHRESMRRMAEQQRLVRLFSAVLGEAPDAITIDNGDLKTDFVNDRFYELFELDKQAAIDSGDPIRFALVEQAKQGAYGEGDPALLAEVRRKDIARQVRASGQVVYERQLRSGRWYEGRLVNLDGHGFVAIYRDFTERRRIEQELSAYRHRLSAILSNTRQGFWFIDVDGNTTDVNPAMCRLLGATRDELLGKTAFDFVDEANAAVFREQLVLRQDGRTDPYEVTLTRADGTTVPCIVAPVALLDDNGERVGSVGIYTEISRLKATEAALRESETRLREAQEIAKIGNWTIDLTTGKLAWSDGMFAIFGRHLSDAEDPRREYLEKVVHPEDLPALLQAQQLSVTTGVPGSLDHRFFRPDGTVGWVHMEGRVEFEESRPVKLHGIAQDITEAKNAELTLRELNETLEQRAEERAALLLAREERFSAVIEKVADIVLIVDPQGRFSYVSPAAETVLGHDPRAVTGERLLDFIHPQDAAFAMEALQKGIEKPGSSVDLQLRARHADGGWRTMAVNGRSLLDQPGIDGILITARDDSERQRALAEVREAQANLSDAIESISSDLLLFDGDGKLLVYNTNYLEHQPLIADQVEVGVTYEHLIRAGFERGATKALPGQNVETMIAQRIADYRNPTGRSEIRQLADGRLMRVKLRRSRGGGVISVGDDVTAETLAEQRLREAQRMEAIGKLTGGMAHDFNNYLGIIIGNLDLLSSGITEPDAAERLIAGAMGASERAADLIRSLLAFSRRQPLDPRVLNPNDRIENVAKLLRRTIGEDIKITLDLADDLWPTTADGAQLESCVLNLANNARDAMPDGGLLRVSTCNRSLDATTLDADDALAPGDYVVMEFSDNGAGMTAETKARAFDPFFTTKEMGNGTGLGLSMVYGFVKQSGGDIRLYSEPGHGTSVRIYLPRTRQPSDAATEQRPSNALPRGSESILVVEDNEELRATVLAQLTPLGYRLFEATDGDAALAMLESGSETIDLLFTDVVMPGQINGRELARVVRERWPSIRVLLTSGFPGDMVADDNAETELLPILSKPYHRRDLAEAIRTLLDTGELPTAATC